MGHPGMKLRLARSIADVRAEVAAARTRGLSIGVVPTMGALHAGHAALIERARAESGFVVVTLFVNPLQFNDTGDYSNYPHNLQADLDLCEERGVDVVFAPSVEEMYPRATRTHVDVNTLTDPMEGRFRPGHFRGVATVVAKLFNIVQPDRAWFGEKDAQQLAVIRRMVDDLNFPVELTEVPTVREASGLAMSSRNQRLSEAERQWAVALYKALEEARRAIESGEVSAAVVKARAAEVLAEYPQVSAEYLEIVDPNDMQPVDKISGPVRVAGAIRIGKTRLIDNVLAAPRRVG
jgi:pantoate--beta-alanine ligase